MDSLSPQSPESFDCLATAALLRSTAPLIHASHAAALAAFLQFRSAPCLFAASLAAWCAVVALAVRLHFDAAAFDLIAGDPQKAAEHFDRFLVSAGLRRPSPPRPIAERCRGALRLWRMLLAAIALQLLLAAAAFLRILS